MGYGVIAKFLVLIKFYVIVDTYEIKGKKFYKMAIRSLMLHGLEC